MSTEKLEKQVAQIQARLAEITKEKAELERAPERAERQLADTQAEEDRQAADVRQGRGNAEDLVAAMRETARLKGALEKLKREVGPKLEKLNADESRLQAELTKVTRELHQAQLSDAVTRYQAALRQALPIADEIRRLAPVAGIVLPPSDEFNPLLERGTHVCGGIVIELR